jgi:hypothetical protein
MASGTILALAQLLLVMKMPPTAAHLASSPAANHAAPLYLATAHTLANHPHHRSCRVQPPPRRHLPRRVRPHRATACRPGQRAGAWLYHSTATPSISPRWPPIIGRIVSSSLVLAGCDRVPASTYRQYFAQYLAASYGHYLVPTLNWGSLGGFKFFKFHRRILQKNSVLNEFLLIIGSPVWESWYTNRLTTHNLRTYRGQ